MKGQVRTTGETFLENELVIATLDPQGRVSTTATVSAESGLATETTLDEINIKIPDAIDIGGGQLVVPVGILAGTIEAVQSGDWDVSLLKATATPTNYLVTPTASTTALASVSCSSVLLVADDTNTGIIYVGGSSINAATGNGTPLTAGDSRNYSPISNANLIYHACSTAGQTLHVEVIL